MRLLRPLRHRPVALLWSGLALSAIGDQVYSVTLTWIAVGTLGAAAGYLSALQAGCLLAATLFGGHWADRWDQRRTLIGADLVRTAALLAMVLAWGVLGTPSAPGLILCVAVLAAGAGVARPAVQAMLPTLLPDRAVLPAANALIDSSERLARLGGPGIVGLLAGLVPERHFLTVNAATFLASAVAVLLIRRVPAPPAEARRRVLDTLLRGVRAVRRDTLLRDCWATSGINNGTWQAVFYLCIPLAIERNGLAGLSGSGARSGLGAFGLVIAAYGCTNLLALLVVGNREMPARPEGQIIASRFVMASGMAIAAATAAFAPPAWMLPGFMLAALVTAPGGPMGDVPAAVMRQVRTEPGEVAAAVRAFIASSQLGAIVALTVAPVLIRGLGLAAVAALCAAGMASLGVGMLVQERAGRYAPPPA